MLSIELAQLTDPGLKRQNNEDFVAYLQPPKLATLQASGCVYIVADGMGGASGGEYASRHAAEMLLSEYYQYPQEDPGARLIKAIQLANRELYEAAVQANKRFATTLVAAVILNDTLIVAHVGDSRAYLIRDGLVSQLTQDHTEAAEMVRKGMLSEEEARQSKSRNRLSRAVGAEEDIQVDLTEGIPLRTGDRILLCSDGLTKYASDELSVQQDLARLSAQGSSQEVAQALVQHANQMSGEDNISVIVLTIGQPLPMKASSKPAPAVKKPRNEDGEDTLSDRFRAQRSTPTPSGLTLRDYAPWIAAGIVLFILSIIIGLLLGRLFFNSGNETPVSPAALLLTQTAISQATLAPATDLPSSTEAAPDSTALPAQTAEMPVSELTEAPALTSTVSAGLPAATLASTVEISATCVYLTKENDMLIPVVEQFDLTYAATNDYHRFDPCAENDAGLLCSNKSLIYPHNVIQAGWWLEINNQTESTCQENGGRWAIIQ